MNKRTQNRLAMYRGVLANLREHQTTWSGIPVMVTAVDTFSNLYEALNSAINQQSLAIAGIRSERDRRLSTIRTEISRVSFALYQLGVRDHLANLTGIYRLSGKEVDGFAQERLNLFVLQLKADLAQYGNDLSDFGLDAQAVSNVVTMLDEVPELLTVVSVKHHLRKEKTREVTRIEQSIRQLLTDTIDGFVYHFSATDPAFYLSYRDARSVIDRRGPATTPREPDDGNAA